MLPKIITEIPGLKSKALAERLNQVESQNITYLSANWPIFWKKSEDCFIWDVDDNKYIDLTSAFGVAGLGHRFSALTETMHAQVDELIHGMGDVHPSEQKVVLCEKLSELTYEKWTAGTDAPQKGKVILGNSGFEAVESALKSAHIVTKKPNIITFKNGYHGLGYGALMGSGYDWFRQPFEQQLPKNRYCLSYPTGTQAWEMFLNETESLDTAQIGALLIEPIQGRGGTVVPEPGVLAKIRQWCTEHDICLIFDEIYTGFHRTGNWFACEHENVIPDFICLAKALSGGYPVSACVGKADLMDHWQKSEGEALHTSTFLGNPLGCAMAITSLQTLSNPEIPTAIEEQHLWWTEALSQIKTPFETRILGRGLMLGLEVLLPDTQKPASQVVIQAVEDLLKKGIIILPESPDAHIFGITPTFTMAKPQIEFCVKTIEETLSAYAQ